MRICPRFLTLREGQTVLDPKADRILLWQPDGF